MSQEQQISPTRILILGQTPPPYGGQAINIQKMIQVLQKHQFNHRVIRMDFSEEISDMGAFNFSKARKLIRIFFQLIWQLLVYQPHLVYYPPAGPTPNAIYRDIILLFPVRLFHFKRIFHYHAGGLASVYDQLNPIIKILYRFVYFNAYSSICLSEHGRYDPAFLRSKQICIIPSGVEDFEATIKEKRDTTFTVLFAGLCSASKGILDFIEVIRICKRSDARIIGKVIGKTSSELEANALRAAEQEGLLTYEGVQTGKEKTAHFNNASLFLFPSSFESENFPTVILEAFSAALPVVSTAWRGIPDQVKDGQNGFLHPPHAVAQMAASVLQLSTDKVLHQQLSINARSDFETKYTMGIFEASMVAYFKSVR